MESRYHGHPFSKAEFLAEESSDRFYREHSQTILDSLDREEIKGYSPSHVASVMTVLECEVGVAMQVCKGLETWGDVDWSEATWEEIYENANTMLELLWVGHFTKESK